MIASIAHLAYHLGAIRQIAKAARGPKEGAFVATYRVAPHVRAGAHFTHRRVNG